MEVALKIFHGLKFASGVEQAADHKMPEHLIVNGSIAYAVIEGSEDQFRPYHLDGGVDQPANETLDFALLRVKTWKQRPFRFFNVIMALGYKS